MLRAKMHMDSARHKVQNEKRVKVMTGSHHKLVEMVQRETHTQVLKSAILRDLRPREVLWPGNVEPSKVREAKVAVLHHRDFGKRVLWITLVFALCFHFLNDIRNMTEDCCTLFKQ